MLLLLFAVLLASCSGKGRYGREICALHDQLEAEIANSATYDSDKEKRLESLKRMARRALTDADRFELNNRLVEEYEAYNSDSALYYLNLNFANPILASMPNEYLALRIKQVDLLAHAGILSSAQEIAAEIPADRLIPAHKQRYFTTMCTLYQYLWEENIHGAQLKEYEALRAAYADSLLATSAEGSLNHVLYGAPELSRRGQVEEAADMVRSHLGDYPVGSREYSMLAATLADIYDSMNQHEQESRFHLLSGISDVKGSIKENTSFRRIAMDCFDDGDLERANRYLKKSISDATFFSARMRNAQSTRVLPLIDDAYSTMQNRLAYSLRVQVTVTTVLVIVLILAVLLILKQYRSLRRAKHLTDQHNAELSDLSGQLKTAVDELAAKNTELNDSNKVKEQYAALFMQYSASAISALQHYQQSLRVLCNQGSSKALLLKKIESSEMIDKAMRDFYSTFDEAVLSIYPNFAEKFNALLQPADRIVLKPGELLNTELRVFALIRLGVDDSAKIAQFLRCSITTVYTYRSKMRKRALDPENFENQVKNIA